MPREKDTPGKGPDWEAPDGAWETEDDSAIATENEQKVERPKLYSVLLHNDDYTTMEFVTMVLTQVFHLSEDEAVRIMLHVHHKGHGVAGTYSFEVAETRADKTMQMAREHEFPLRCTVEPA
jgi:ATP-dependent Clp protease adaptor protein ClpS